MKPESEQILAACIQLANLTRDVLSDTATRTSEDMWEMVYGHLQVPASSPQQMMEAFEHHLNVLNKAAGTMIMVMAQMYAREVGISDIEAVDRLQALVQAAFESE